MAKLMTPVGKQRYSILHSDAWLNLWEGSVRSSKTVASIIRWAQFVALEAPPDGELLMLGKTERTLQRNVLHPLQDLVGAEAMRISLGAGEATLFGRRIYIGGANDEKAESKIRGLTLAGLYGDEVSTWPQSVFTMATTRLSVPGAKAFFTSNPDSPLHWLMVEWLERAEAIGMRHFHFTLRDNPHLDPEFVARLEATYTGLWKKRFIDGEWVVAEGAIYDMLDDEHHLVDELPKLVQHWSMADYGTTNPTTWAALSLGEDSRLYVHHEYRWDSVARGRQKTDPEYSKDYRDWLAEMKELGVEPRFFFVDPSAASWRLQLWRDGVSGVAPADNEVLDGIRDVSALLTARKLRFHRPTTVELWKGLSGYVWDPAAQLRGEDKPLKLDDHGPDMLRYGVRGTRGTWHRWLGARLQEQAKEAAA